jgi:hypothetical protein
MLRSESLIPKLISKVTSALKFQKRGGLLFFCVTAAFLTLLPSAFGQDFSMAAAPFNPFAVAPGQDSASNISLVALNGFTGTVDLTCTVTSQTTGTPPTCDISPASVRPSGGATATITTLPVDGVAITPGLYTITVTGTSPSTTLSASQNLTVLAVTPQFTITVGTPIAPSSVPAGSGAIGKIDINPINGYSGTVTLSCSSISPLVVYPPVCSFNPQPVTVESGTVGTSTITITSAGPVTTGAVAHPRSFYGLWLPLPMLALVGLGAAAGGKRSRKAWGLLALFVVSGSLLLMPACGNTPTVSTPNRITPNNTYTFTVTGIDTMGNTSSNASTSSTPSVSLTVTSPPTT